MKDDLIRFGVTMDPALVAELDKLAAARSCNRSELLRELVRAAVTRSALKQPVAAIAAVTIVYDHFVRDLAERLISLLNELGEQVCSSLHVRLDPDYSLETIVLRGRSDHLKEVSERILGMRGVVQGRIEYVVSRTLGTRISSRSAQRGEY